MSQRPIGVAISFLNLPSVPPEYEAAVLAVRATRAIGARYTRPVADKQGDVLNPIGSLFKEQRRVTIGDDPLAHVAAAARCRFPDRFEEKKLPAVLLAVIEGILDKGGGLAAFRCSQGQKLCDVVDSLQALDALCVSRMPPHVAFACRGVRAASIAALVEGLDWPDVRLAERFVTGFPVAGSGAVGEAGPDDSGVFVSLVRAAATSLAELARGHSRGFASNAQWLGQACGVLRRKANKAKAEGPGSRAAKELAGLEESCEKEVRATPHPTMLPPLTLRKLVAWALPFGGIRKVRVILCFMICQGKRADGTDKVRRIDNCKSNGLNAACRTVETVSCISFMFPIFVARAFVSAARARQCPCPRLWLGLDDLKAAYRMVPVMQIWLSVLAVWSLRHEKPMFYRMPGHAFGMLASVVNFCRLPAFVCYVAQAILLVAVSHYMDDFVHVDVAEVENSAHDALRLVLRLLGFDVELDKRQYAAPSNTVLGVRVSLAHAHRQDGYATAEATEKRVAKVLGLFRDSAATGSLSPTVASKLRGLLGFTLSAANWRFGRAACQSLSARVHSARPPYKWSPALRATHAFFERTLPRLPPR